MATIKGIDVSYCQKGFDFAAAIMSGVSFVMVRAGISTRMDTEAENHLQAIAKTGLAYGLYWYSRAFSVAEAEKEAAACLSFIRKHSPVYPIYYDMEDKDQIDRLTTEQRTQIITAFCTAISTAGYKPGVYLNPAWLENYVDKSKLVGKYPIWLAHWIGAPDKPSRYNYGQEIWQWGTEVIGGMTVDADIAYKEYQLRASSTSAVSSAPQKKGKRLALNGAELYASAFAKAPVRYLNGTYYLYDGIPINGFTRICPASANVGKLPLGSNVTGYIKISDI